MIDAGRFKGKFFSEYAVKSSPEGFCVNLYVQEVTDCEVRKLDERDLGKYLGEDRKVNKRDLDDEFYLIFHVHAIEVESSSDRDKDYVEVTDTYEYLAVSSYEDSVKRYKTQNKLDTNRAELWATGLGKPVDKESAKKMVGDAIFRCEIEKMRVPFSN
jgi:hypothetical protein